MELHLGESNIHRHLNSNSVLCAWRPTLRPRFLKPCAIALTFQIQSLRAHGVHKTLSKLCVKDRPQVCAHAYTHTHTHIHTHITNIYITIHLAIHINIYIYMHIHTRWAFPAKARPSAQSDGPSTLGVNSITTLFGVLANKLRCHVEFEYAFRFQLTKRYKPFPKREHGMAAELQLIV